MTNSASNWQNSLNTQLLKRLNRPLEQPGMMEMSMSQRIINRSDRILARLPLLSQQMQRWGNINKVSSNSIPIVYAQPILKEQGDQKNQLISSLTLPQYSSASPQSITTNTSTESMPIQAKMATSESLTSPSLLNPESSPQSPEIYSNNIQENNIYSSEYPIVSPQSITNNLSTESMPIQRKIVAAESLTSPSLLNPESSPQPSAISSNNILENNIYSSEYPIVSPQSITTIINNLSTGKMPLVTYKQISSNQEPFNPQILISNPSLVTNTPQDSQENFPIKKILLLSTKSTTEDKHLPIVKIQNFPTSIPNKESENQQEQFNKNNSNYPHTLPIVSPIILSTPSQSSPLPLVTTSLPSRNSPNPLNQNQAISTPEKNSPSSKIFASSSPPTETVISPLTTQSKVDIDAIASQVERKLMRRLVIESERRGKTR